jgi:hypothetical protein
MANDWSQPEVEAIVADYFDMLLKELAGQKYVKAQHNRNVQKLLDNRSRQSVEWKYRNVSAVLVRLGAPYIRGYIPAWNYQGSLLNAVVKYREAHPELEKLFDRFAAEPVSVEVPRLNFEDMLTGRPKPEPADPVVEEPSIFYGRTINYLEREQQNSAVGKSGEEVALEYERWRLIKAGKESLADKVEWVSQTKGDGLGFDIRSWSENGKDRFIEVKSTKLTKEAPIFFTRNEYNFARLKRDQFYLYRVFNLRTDPKLFIVNGGYDDFCRATPVQYKGYF